MLVSPSIDCGDAMLTTLCSFIAVQIPDLTVKNEWPYANEELKLPSVTISTNKPKRTPLSQQPYEKQSLPDHKNMVTVQQAVAFWEDTFQIDLWCSDKQERKDFTARIIELFESEQLKQRPGGLSLPMSTNFDEIARFEIESVQCIDDEASAQRQERREKITVLVNCREIKQYSYYAMKSIQLQTQVGNPDQQNEITGV